MKNKDIVRCQKKRMTNRREGRKENNKAGVVGIHPRHPRPARAVPYMYYSSFNVSS